MAQDKRQLQQLLNYIEELVKPENGNEWFLEKLDCLIRKYKSNRTEGSDQIDMIKTYLGLDFMDKDIPEYEKYAWSKDSIYDFVKDERVKRNLYSDWHEMIRHRYGTRMHKVDFEECCRYAAIQMERLLNYYFVTSTGNNNQKAILKVAEKQKDKKGNISTNKSGRPKLDLANLNRIEQIQWYIKLESFNAYLEEVPQNTTINKFDKKIVEMIAYVRNNASHGALEDLDEKIGNIKKEYPQCGILSFYPESLDKITDSKKRSVIEDMISRKGIDYESFKTIMISHLKNIDTKKFYSNRDFDKIINTLVDFSKNVSYMLQNNI